MYKWSKENTIRKLESIIDGQLDKNAYCFARYKNDLSIDLRTNTEYQNGFYYGFDYKQDSDLFNSAYFNVIKSVIDSIVSKLANQKVRPFFTPVNGTYKTRRIVKQCQQFFDSYYEFQRIQSKITKAFEESCIFSVGYLFVNPLTYEVEVPPSWNVATLNTESVYGEPTKLLIKYPNYPTTLLDKLGINDADINSEYVTLEMYCDIAEKVFEVYINNNMVKSISYTAERLPIVKIFYNIPILGNYTPSIVEELDGIQTQIDLISAKISAAAQLTPANTTYVLEGSNLSPGDINNRIGNVYGVKCPPGMTTLPVMNVTPSPIDPYWQSLMEYYIQKAYEVIGISQLSAMSKKPAGLDSGTALQTMEDVESDRFETQVMQYVNAFIELAKTVIAVIPDTADILPNTKQSKSFKWSDVKRQSDLFKVQYSAQSALSKDPQEKVKQVLQLREQGFLSNYEVPLYLDLPDLQNAYEGAQAVENAVDALIERCIEEGDTDIPEYIDYQQLAQKITIVENQLSASYTGNKKDDEDVALSIECLQTLESKLMNIMEENGFIAKNTEAELGENANVATSLSAANDISTEIKPSETLNEEPLDNSVANNVDENVGVE